MVKFGLRLAENRASEYPPDSYMDYDKLKEIIKEVAGKKLARVDSTTREVSLTAPPPTNAAGRQLTSDDSPITEEDFYACIDAQLVKVEAFTLKQVTELRSNISSLEKEVNAASSAAAGAGGGGSISSALNKENEAEVERVREKADMVAKSFLVLEKYVNINFMGFHKILKKHDKNSPSHACKQFYINRMHNQAWVRGDYSDVVVRLSAIYSALRNDHAAEENVDASQSFSRSTTKYWVRTEDVSKVKYAILKHLPVFLQKTSTGDSDSQLTNSVYFDNDQLELYHGRLDKSPGAIAFRLRWYGSGDPQLVFVERKTHRDTWTGEASVKERFIVDKSEVKPVLDDNYSIAQKREKMASKKGVTLAEVEDWETLVREMIQVVQSKQLVPTMRTQYMRTAFQIPFDATVRISLDTNLCMISERGYDTQGGAKWFRDPEKPLADNEITRFPHAVLEVKLELGGANAEPPQWVTDLQNSGMLYEVHKFSKFIHGCATLLPEYVRSVPYWVDDASIRDSILRSGGGRILVKSNSETGVGPGANEIYNHLLPFGNVKTPQLDAKGRTANTMALIDGGGDKSPEKDAPLAATGDQYFAGADETDEEIVFNATVQGCCEDTCAGWLFPFCSGYNEDVLAPTSVQKIEPKIFFANERTFLHWLHAGVTLYTIAAGILAFASDTHSVSAHWYAMALLPISLGFCLYALHLFLWRAEKIKTRIPGRWDDSRGPLILGAILAGVLFINFVLKCREIRKYNYMMAHEL
mmetsp:Transcript_5442/g.12397  ORF Transcript_5442/g.12397 Transcript_5442/m.12397 type:complete len:755 (-) Transcript_5442:123-2387(-)|eukprot:CAMPEP_0172298182 /NCGR_PEP_ID=MMETSP1058-20130122/949_1 /TAXON_ID=83371 /ORGANISM="Detonula confervacea, Strain CCMP 353" /LENGTH=754 /DNA_ID=CAMNT_0013007437 /DNA_START=50 /DNA_END=2314 /DNA_ORIENTATION=+